MEIYRITNLLNGKNYIGQTRKTLSERWFNHIKKSKYHNSKVSSAIWKAISKYGQNNFSIESLCKCSSLKELNEKEVYFINKFNSLAPNGYNLRSGGESWEITEEFRKNLSKAHTGLPSPRKGKKFGPNKKLSEWRKGRKLGPQTKEWIENRVKKLRGQKRTLEQKLALSKAHLKPIKLYRKDTNFEVILSSAGECPKYGFSKRTAFRRLKDKKSTKNGYYIEYVRKAG